MILEGFGRPKWMQKSIFGRFFKKRRLSQNHCFSSRKLLFLRFRAYKFNENSMKNRVRKYICFKRRFFSVFCGFLFDFVTILDGPKSSKIRRAACSARRVKPYCILCLPYHTAFPFLGGARIVQNGNQILPS